MAYHGQELRYAIPYAVNIHASANGGFFVEIGCCKLIFQNHRALLAGLRKYFEDPVGWAKKYNKLSVAPPNEQAMGVTSGRVRINASDSGYTWPEPLERQAVVPEEQIDPPTE